MPASIATEASSKSSAPTAPTEGAQSPPNDFEQLLQGLSQPDSTAESALPELLAVVASLAGSSNLLKGIEKPTGSKDLPKEKPPQGTTDSDSLAALQALLAGLQTTPQPGAPAADAKAEAQTSQPQPSIDVPADELGEIGELQDLKPEGDSSKPVLNLKDFDVRRFEFKTELEIATVQPKLIRVVPLPGMLQGQWKASLTEPKPVKGSSDIIETAATASAVFGGKFEAPLITAPEAVARVQVAIEPPPPPPVVRQISMDIGDPDSQVRVIIRERNGDLALQFGAATERLRENLQNAAPLLMHELRRDNPHTVSLDFSKFGTATESGNQSHQDSRRKKSLKSDAVFAEVDETAYLGDETPSANSF